MVGQAVIVRVWVNNGGEGEYGDRIRGNTDDVRRLMTNMIKGVFEQNTDNAVGSEITATTSN